MTSDAEFRQSIIRLHDKIDNLTTDVSEIKISFAPFPFRVKILEKIVYCGVGLILIAFTTAIIHSVLNPGTAKASKQNTAIVKTIK